MKIPVFHDDQHGTAIVTAAGILNALEITGRKIGDATIACNGAGAAAIACLNLLVSFGASKDNILVCDRKGVIHAERTDLDQYKGAYAVKTGQAHAGRRDARAPTSSSASRRRISVTQDMVKSMAARPIIFAMANPDPEIRPEARPRGPRRRDRRHRALGLSEPGQQRALLPVHLPRRARLRRDRDQRADEARLRRGDRGDGARRGLRRGARRLRRREPAASAPTTSSRSPSTRG